MKSFYENYNIDIANNNVIRPIFLSVGVIKLLLYEDFHDTGIERYYFNTKLVSEKNKYDINWKINYLLFDLYNSFCYLTNKTVLITHDRNNPNFCITKNLNTIDLIVNRLRNKLDLISDLYAEELLKISFTGVAV